MGELDVELLRDGAAYADQWMAYQQDRRDLPGAVLAIWHRDRLVLSRGYGYANLEREMPMTPWHIFRVASHSKMFTATAVMQLVERGALRLDDRLAAFIPWLDGQEGLAALTIRQALHHATGLIRDGADAEYWQLDDAFPDAEGLRRRAQEGGVVLAANERFKYSNIGYALLGLVIEAASGLPYNDYVMRQIVQRLGLADTGPETDAHARERLATGYTARRLGLPRRSIPDVPTHALSPATGFYATAEDLCRFAAAHFMGNDTLLSDASKREMQQPAWEIERDDERYGLGMCMVKIGERRMVGHGGAFPGHATRTLLDPYDGLAVVMLVNEIGGPADLLARSVARTIDFALRQPPRSAERASDPGARFSGRFVDLWGVADVGAFGASMLVLNPNEEDPTASATWLEPLDDDTLRLTRTNGYAAPGETLRAIRDEEGRVAKIVMAGSSMYPLEAYRARQEPVAYD